MINLKFMNDSCQIYEQQVNKAKETVAILEDKLHEIRLKIQKKNRAEDLQELRKITLDMTITLNELEHCQYNLEKCIKQNKKVKEK